jgi:hypothetical protein
VGVEGGYIYVRRTAPHVIYCSMINFLRAGPGGQFYKVGGVWGYAHPPVG